MAKAGKLVKIGPFPVHTIDEMVDLAKTLSKPAIKAEKKPPIIEIPAGKPKPAPKANTKPKPDADKPATKDQPKPKPKIKDIELDEQGRFRDKNGNLRTNAGPNAPEFKKWKENGGTTKYDEATDTIIYGKPGMETSSMGKMDVEVSYKPGPPDGQRYPDFSNYSRETVEIPDMKGIREQYIDAPEGGDFSKAWEELSQQKGDKYIQDNFDVNRRVKGSRIGQWPDKSPKDLTWHHNGNKSSMQLVDQDIHDIFTHKGGASASR